MPTESPRSPKDGPAPLSEQVRARFIGQGRRDTAPEMALRRLLHARGLRYRVDRAVVPGLRRRADLVFGPARVAVFVDGCFWHACPEHRAPPRNNADWWQKKLAATATRDRDTDRRLREAGWSVIRVWEHESPADAANLVEAEVRRRRPAGALGRQASAAR